MATNILIILDTQTGTTEKLSIEMKNVLTNINSNVRLCRVSPVNTIGSPKETLESNIPIITVDDLKWAEGYIVSFPIHTGTITAALKYFLDEQHLNASKGIFLNKPVTAITLGKLAHAGAETAIQQLFTTLMQWGTLIVSTGISNSEIIKKNGNPYGLSFILDNKVEEESEWINLLKIHLSRFQSIVEVTNKLASNYSEKSTSPYTINQVLG